MALLLGLALVAGSAALVGAALAWGQPHRAEVAANLARSTGGAQRAATGPAHSGRGAGRAAPLLVRRLPDRGVRRLEGLLAAAGRPPAWPLARVVSAKALLTAVATVLGGLYLWAGPSAGRLLLVLVVVPVSFFVPELLLHSRAQERRELMARDLADTLDQMTIAVEAGLGFDGAVARVARSGTGPLAEELLRTLQDVQVGVSRREAFKALAERNQVPDLQRFVSALLQADAYGVSVGTVLRTQAREMRIKRRQATEEKAMQLPVKVIFPLVLCILPVLFIVLLGPAVVDMTRSFGG